MINCPYCLFPLVGPASVKVLTCDSFELIRSCTHCEVIMRFEITTLKPPKDKFRKNTTSSEKKEAKVE
jgi:RNase P subunit RPR2